MTLAAAPSGSAGDVLTVILAGGLGTRLRAVVGDLPKSMAPFRGRPFLEWQISLVSRSGLARFLLCVGYRREEIMRHFGDGSRWGWSIRYAEEDRPLGTAGALRNARPSIAGRFLLLNGDTHLDIDYADFLRRHREFAKTRNAVGTIATINVPDPRQSGRIRCDATHRILSFDEKSPEASAGNVNAGVYAFEEAVFDLIPSTVPCSLEREVIPSALERGVPLYACTVEGTFVDIGTEEGYKRYMRIEPPTR